VSPVLSVLIPTVMWREEKFLALLSSLLPQCEDSNYPIEVIAVQNVGQLSLARYRHDLLAAARGAYVCFIDDDDTVSPDYVYEITAALSQEPDVVGFLQECSGTGAPLTILSLAIPDSPELGVVSTHWGLAYIRCFSHMCPVRAELARQGTFFASGEVYTGEDTSYVSSVLPLLRERGSREVFINKPLYHYRWSASDTTQNRGTAPTGIIARAAAHKRPRITSHCFRWIS
jgi:Glycosyl transferase family 2